MDKLILIVFPLMMLGYIHSSFLSLFLVYVQHCLNDASNTTTNLAQSYGASLLHLISKREISIIYCHRLWF